VNLHLNVGWCKYLVRSIWFLDFEVFSIFSILHRMDMDGESWEIFELGVFLIAYAKILVPGESCIFNIRDLTFA